LSSGTLQTTQVALQPRFCMAALFVHASQPMPKLLRMNGRPEPRAVTAEQLHVSRTPGLATMNEPNHFALWCLAQRYVSRTLAQKGGTSWVQLWVSASHGTTRSGYQVAESGGEIAVSSAQRCHLRPALLRSRSNLPLQLTYLPSPRLVARSA